MPKADILDVRIFFDREKPHSVKDEIRTAKRVAKGIKKSVFFFYEFDSVRVFPNGKVQRWRQIGAPKLKTKLSEQSSMQEYDEL